MSAIWRFFFAFFWLGYSTWMVQEVIRVVQEGHLQRAAFPAAAALVAANISAHYFTRGPVGGGRHQ